MNLPENIKDLRQELLNILNAGGFAPFEDMGVSIIDTKDAIEEFVLIYELKSKPSACQTVMAKIFLTVLQSRIKNG